MNNIVPNIAVISFALCASSAANAELIWTGINREVQASVSSDIATDSDSAQNFESGLWSDSVSAGLTEGAFSTSLSSSQTSDLTSTGITATLNTMSHTSADYPGIFASSVMSEFTIHFMVTTASLITIDFDYMNNDPASEVVLLTLDPDISDPIYADFLADDRSGSESFMVESGGYSIQALMIGSITADGLDHEGTLDFSMTVESVPTPSTLALLTPAALFSTRRRR